MGLEVPALLDDVVLEMSMSSIRVAFPIIGSMYRVKSSSSLISCFTAIFMVDLLALDGSQSNSLTRRSRTATPRHSSRECRLLSLHQLLRVILSCAIFVLTERSFKGTFTIRYRSESP